MNLNLCRMYQFAFVWLLGLVTWFFNSLRGLFVVNFAVKKPKEPTQKTIITEWF